MSLMKAIKYSASKDGIELINVPKPTNPKPGFAIVKVAYAGVCGTDLHIISRKFIVSPEVILGHETTGIVTEIGEGVSNVKVGDHVAISSMNYGCQACRLCIINKPNLCSGNDPRNPGGLFSVPGMWHDGGWAEYYTGPAEMLVPLPSTLHLKEGVLFEPASGLSCSFKWNQGLHITSRILVIGAGIIGLLWSGLFHYQGYRDITIVEISEKRRKVASNLELGYKVHHPDEIAKLFEDQSCPEENGFDYIADASGSPEAVEKAFTWIRCGGRMNLFGIAEEGSAVKLDPSQITLKEISIFGSNGHAYSFYNGVQFVNNMAKEYLNFEKLGIKTYKLDEYHEALDALAKHEITKAVFQLDH